MKRIRSRMERWVGRRFPTLYYQLFQRPRLYFRFSKERRLASGETLSQSNQRSLIFFTTQKCASRYVSEVLDSLATPAGMVHADYDAYVTMARIPKEKNPFSPVGLPNAFRSQGYYYGPIGTFRDVPDLESYSVVLQLRDPRDMLTSLYFSTAFSHALINPKMIRRRKEALSLDVDEYVLKEAKEYQFIYAQYCEMLLGKKNVLFLKYEDMVADFPNWLQKLADHTGLAGQKIALDAIRKRADFSVDGEDKYAQRRQVAPGDHLRKLKPDTIQQLNSLFGSVLKQLNYD